MADLECELPKHISDPVILGSAGGREGDATQNEPKPRPQICRSKCPVTKRHPQPQRLCLNHSMRNQELRTGNTENKAIYSATGFGFGHLLSMLEDNVYLWLLKSFTFSRWLYFG